MQNIEYQCKKYIHCKNRSRRCQMRVATICASQPAAGSLTPECGVRAKRQMRETENQARESPDDYRNNSG